MPNLPQPLASCLAAYFDVEFFGKDWSAWVLSDLARTEDRGLAFRQQFADAIVHCTITPAEFESITRDDAHPTPEALEARLRELWTELYGPLNAPEVWATVHDEPLDDEGDPPGGLPD